MVLPPFSYLYVKKSLIVNIFVNSPVNTTLNMFYDTTNINLLSYRKLQMFSYLFMVKCSRRYLFKLLTSYEALIDLPHSCWS